MDSHAEALMLHHVSDGKKGQLNYSMKPCRLWHFTRSIGVWKPRVFFFKIKDLNSCRKSIINGFNKSIRVVSRSKTIGKRLAEFMGKKGSLQSTLEILDLSGMVVSLLQMERRWNGEKLGG